MILRNIKSKKNWSKRAVVETGFLALARGLQSCSHFEEDIQHEIDHWPEGFSFCMRVLPDGPAMSMIKEKGTLRYTGKKTEVDMDVQLKNLETAFRMITTQTGIPQVYAAHGIGVAGDVAKSLSLIRMIHRVEAYLFPQILSKNILKKVPEMTLRKQVNRLRIYTIGMLWGK